MHKACLALLVLSITLVHSQFDEFDDLHGGECTGPDSKKYQTGQSFFKPDDTKKCTFMICQGNNWSAYTSIQCNECKNGETKVEVKNSCCPRCVPGTKKSCSVGAITYKDSDPVTSPNACESKCACQDGTVVCQEQIKCPACKPGEVLAPVKGRCCGDCEVKQEEPRCIVSGKSYSDGQTWKQDVCTTCKCVVSGNDVTHLCTRATCPKLDCNEKDQVDIDGCCKKCKDNAAKICRSSEGKTYQIGDVVPPKAGDDPQCYSCKCIESGDIMCSSPVCPTVCPKGTILEKERGKKCCRECLPDASGTCLVDGVIIPNNGRIPNTNKCEHCTCMNGKKSCAALDCPSCPEGTTPGKKEEGDCCVTCIVKQPTTECVEGGRVYKIDQSIPSDDICQQCVCTRAGKWCGKTECYGCPDGWNAVPFNGKCCGLCKDPKNPAPVSDSCKDDKGTVYKVGDSMPGVDNCQYCRCTSTGKTCETQKCQCPEGYAPSGKRTDGKCCQSCIQCMKPYQIATDKQCDWTCGAGTEPDAARYVCKCKEGFVQAANDALGRITCQKKAEEVDPCAVAKCTTDQVCKLSIPTSCNTAACKPVAACQPKPKDGDTQRAVCQISLVNKCSQDIGDDTYCDDMKRTVNCAVEADCNDWANFYCVQNWDDKCIINNCNMDTVKKSRCVYDKYDKCVKGIAKTGDYCVDASKRFQCADESGCYDWIESTCAQVAQYPDACKTLFQACKNNAATQFIMPKQLEDLSNKMKLPHLMFDGPQEHHSNVAIMVVGALVALLAVAAVILALVVAKLRRREAAADMYVEMEERTTVA